MGIFTLAIAILVIMVIPSQKKNLSKVLRLIIAKWALNFGPKIVFFSKFVLYNKRAIILR